ncbi:hypothetical protein O0L34_g10311 [Tuta absoluta]|nr:hypothetical protein O0L34_g10311 [Tuta absoluta]
MLPDGSRRRIEVLSELKSLMAAFPAAKDAKAELPKKMKDSASKSTQGPEATNVSAVNETAAPGKNAAASTNAASEAPDLVFAFMIFRHGDRTPTEDSLSHLHLYYNNKLKVRELVEQWGYREMTKAGFRTSYKTGEFIRNRYEELLSPKYKESEVYIRSLDSTRAKLSALVAMAAVYPVSKNNATNASSTAVNASSTATDTSSTATNASSSETNASSLSWSDINWMPVPYSSDLLKDDNILGTYHNCEKLGLELKTMQDYHGPFSEENRELVTKLADVLQVHDIKLDLIIETWQAISGLLSMGANITETLMEAYSESSPVFDEAWKLLFEKEDLVKMATGYLLNEFFVYADKIIRGEKIPRLRIYSAHDMNVYSFQLSTAVTPQGRPKFGSLYSLELRKSAEGEYSVLPVYLEDPHEGTETYLEVQGCDSLCNYTSFKNLTSRFRTVNPTRAERHCQSGYGNYEPEYFDPNTRYDIYKDG